MRVLSLEPISLAFIYWVYILQNPDGKFYIGHTDDLPARLQSHNRTDKLRGKFTRKNGPWVYVWGEECLTRSAAMRRERQIKRMKSAPTTPSNTTSRRDG